MQSLTPLIDPLIDPDAGITSAILDRVLHHAETVIIEPKSDS